MKSITGLHRLNKLLNNTNVVEKLGKEGHVQVQPKANLVTLLVDFNGKEI